MLSLLVTLVLAALGSLVYLGFARRLQILDHPNHRSSHVQPTPHGGGVPLLLAFATGTAIAALQYGLWPGQYLLLLGAALLLMLLGVVDDLLRLSVALRMGCYTAITLLVALALLWNTWSGPGLLLLTALAALGLLWSLNLYNFMDGIDGIAAIQCIIACVCIALLVLGGGGDQRYVLFCLLLAAAQLGFLLFNWPPARLFMGDAGSIPTGFLLAALALLGWIEGIVAPACWLIVGAVFITDASWTLCLRLAQGKRITDAHREHAYQRLARHWGSHLLVDLLLLAINALWLFPLAWLATLWPGQGWILVILAYLPLAVAMARIRNLT